MKTEAVRHSAFHQLTQENHVLAYLLHRNMEVLHAVIYVLQVVELVVVGREKRLCPVAIFMYIFHDGAGYRHSVVCGGSAADLVKQHQRAGREVVEDHRSLEHLHHERGFAAGNVV